MKHKSIILLGSTGSIGTNTLDIVRRNPTRFSIHALAAKNNIDLLEEQVREFKPKVVVVFDASKALLLQKRIPDVTVLQGLEGLIEICSGGEGDFLVSAMTGTIGIAPTLAAIQKGKEVGLANKEVLVSAGEVIMKAAKQHGVTLMPIDSEHSALFQCLLGSKREEVSRLILTASGGPFRTFSDEKLQSVTVEQALCHPSWKMGPKVTIDCSTLMNKGLEMIEAHYLFNLPFNQIEIVVHPTSIVHSMVEFKDGSIMAQLAEPDMRLPIQYALTYPERIQGVLAPFDFTKHRTLEFYPYDQQKFIAISLCYEAIKQGGSLPCFMNAANEVLVNRFLDRKISWKEIGLKLRELMSSHKVEKDLNLDTIYQIDQEARERAQAIS